MHLSAALQSALLRAKVRVPRDEVKHTQSPRVNSEKTTDTHSETHTHIEGASRTHRFQSGSLEQTARHCRELELKTQTEEKKESDCF